MNRQEIREEILEPWLAETGSDFYTDAVINQAVAHEYRLFCAKTGGGPVAQFEETGDGTTRSWQLPAELVDIRRVDYDTTKDEVPFLPFEHFSIRFGDAWIANTGTGLPDAYAVLGSHSVLFEPIPANLKTFRLYGPIVPDAPTGDGSELLVTEADAYTISKRAYVWLIERNLSRIGSVPANYQQIKAEAITETQEARARIHKMHGGIRIAGKVSSGVSATLIAQRYGPLLDWSSA